MEKYKKPKRLFIDEEKSNSIKKINILIFSLPVILFIFLYFNDNDTLSSKIIASSNFGLFIITSYIFLTDLSYKIFHKNKKD
ncbi:hypothetical protein QJU11_09915 [Pasteurella atlantica]|uniref:hypothetical protein n=1 Tax=Phocoenobacter atlanticus TaxID=3416742 RepID=UPI002745A955|nr:hypothetical protein [Pasteurella atlantica]MDP8042506.1 hypothetical protein [Pasteurella atlantica]